MAFTTEQINTLKAAIASGTRTVRYADKEITYQSTAEMLEALAMMQRSQESATRGVPRFQLADFSD